MKYNLPRGTFDILPAESYKWDYVLNHFKKSAATAGYQQIVTPIFELAGLFERSSGESSDVVSKEMYKFTDKKGREFALRPEGTAPVVRSMVNNNLAVSNPRLYYIGPMFRYDRPQKGRYRQFYQYGLECFNSDHPYTDAEVIGVAAQFINSLGLTDIILEINSLGNPQKMQKYEQVLIDYFSPHKNNLCPDCLVRIQKNPRRLLDCKIATCKNIAADAPNMLDYLDEEAATHFAQVQEYLQLMSVKYIVNPKIVRGLDYYSHTAFEFLNPSLGAQSAILAGGRYNGLAEQLGGKATPGIGFAGGVSRLLLSLEAAGCSFGKIPSPQIYVVSLGEAAQKVACTIVQKLRQNEINVAFDINKSKMNAQMKAADKSGAGYAMIIGEDELAASIFVLKDLKNGQQWRLNLSEIIDKLK